MGKPSQRKGRGAERELRDILNAAGFSARTLGLWEKLDVACDFGTGREELIESKRKADGMKPAYDAFANGADVFCFRADRKEWLIVHTVADYIRKHGPSLAGDRVGNEVGSVKAGLVPSSQSGSTPLVRAKRPPMCDECGKYPADPPSRLCPGCEAYQEHTGWA